MNSRERMKATLGFEQPDRIPHFESMFELEYEAFGMRFPEAAQWKSMSPAQHRKATGLCMDIYQRIIERYCWDALCVYSPWSDPYGVQLAKERFGQEILIGGFCGSGVWSIENVEDWMQFSLDVYDNPNRLLEEAERMCEGALNKIDLLAEAGADFIFMPNDIAFNGGPFIAPEQLRTFVFPFWKRQVERIKEHGIYAFLHTDGQITPILDDLIDLGADCLQSIDPMAGVDIAEVRQRTFGKLALMGNVQCSLLQDGPQSLIRSSAEYCLTHASAGGGYIYSTSNTIMKGLPLENYEYMLSILHDFEHRGQELKKGE